MVHTKQVILETTTTRPMMENLFTVTGILGLQYEKASIYDAVTT